MGDVRVCALRCTEKLCAQKLSSRAVRTTLKPCNKLQTIYCNAKFFILQNETSAREGGGRGAGAKMTTQNVRQPFWFRQYFTTQHHIIFAFATQLHKQIFGIFFLGGRRQLLVLAPSLMHHTLYTRSMHEAKTNELSHLRRVDLRNILSYPHSPHASRCHATTFSMKARLRYKYNQEPAKRAPRLHKVLCCLSHLGRATAAKVQMRSRKCVLSGVAPPSRPFYLISPSSRRTSMCGDVC